ncbi:MAG: hypothetical protein AABY07_05980, partial [Nanoarchaeota archaeon]
DDINYLYIIDGNATIQNTTVFSTVVGINRSLVAIAIANRDAGTNSGDRRAYLVSMNAGTPVVAANRVIANQLSAISANMGTITTGAIRIPTGTADIINTATFEGFTINGARIAGYRLIAGVGTLMTELRSSDGRFYAGAGSTILDDLGIRIIAGTNGASFLTFENPALTIRGRFWSDSTDGLTIAGAGSPGDITFSTATAVKPSVDGTDLGTTTRRWEGFFSLAHFRTQAVIRLYDADNSNSIDIRSPAAVTGSPVYDLPSALPSDNNRVLASSTIGIMEWIPLGTIFGGITSSQHGTLGPITNAHAFSDISGTVSSTQHGTIGSLDLHTPYILADGSRALTSDWACGRNIDFPAATTGLGSSTTSGDLLLNPISMIRSFGDILPSTSAGANNDNVWKLGASGNRWTTIWAVTTNIGDILLEGYAIAETKDGIFFFNHKCLDPENHGFCSYDKQDIMMIITKEGDIYQTGQIFPLTSFNFNNKILPIPPKKNKGKV